MRRVPGDLIKKSIRTRLARMRRVLIAAPGAVGLVLLLILGLQAAQNEVAAEIAIIQMARNYVIQNLKVK